MSQLNNVKRVILYQLSNYLCMVHYLEKEEQLQDHRIVACLILHKLLIYKINELCEC
jgi:hypothetical protein